MNKSLADWEAARVFLTVVRAGSMLAGARALGSSQPSVTRAIQRLEQAAGQTLLVRHARGIRLTPTGEQLRAHAERAEAALQSFDRVARSTHEVRGCLRIATTEFIGVEVLGPRLGELRELYPQLRLELVLQNVASDLARGDADVAVRLFRPKQPALVTKWVTKLGIGFFAAEEYLAKHPAPRSLEDLLTLELIGYDPRGPFGSSAQLIDPRLTPASFAVGTDCLSAQVALCRFGFGVACLQVGFAQRYPELRRVVPDLPLPEVDVWLVTHEDLRSSGHVRAGFEWLESVLLEYGSVR
jgi:DNA-binding transcriptional LysR family regulator